MDTEYRIKDVTYGDGSHAFYPQRKYSFFGIIEFWKTIRESDGWGDTQPCRCSTLLAAKQKIKAEIKY